MHKDLHLNSQTGSGKDCIKTKHSQSSWEMKLFMAVMTFEKNIIFSIQFQLSRAMVLRGKDVFIHGA